MTQQRRRAGGKVHSQVSLCFKLLATGPQDRLKTLMLAPQHCEGAREVKEVKEEIS